MMPDSNSASPQPPDDDQPRPDADAGEGPVSFHLLLGSAGAVDVIHAPGWWTLERILMVCGALAVVAVIAVAWVAALRVRVARQTSLIRRHLANETLYGSDVSAGTTVASSSSLA